MKKKRTKDHPDIFRLIRKGLLIMKLSLLLIVVGVLQSAASVYSQTWRMSLNEKSMTVKEVLSRIESTSDFRFFYEEKKIDVEKKVTIDVSNASITVVLSQLFDKEGVEYKIFNNNYIVLKPKGENSSFTMETLQQQKSVSGKVSDSSGSPLPGVSVVVKGTTNGTITDTNGNYSLPNVPENGTLQFSFVGMKGQEVAVTGKTSINVKLEEETVGIEEVVAVGYGVQKKINLTGALSTVSGEKLKESPVMNITQSLAGRLPGLFVKNTSGAPGKNDAVSYNIRGFGTPLIIQDGTAITPAQFALINPNEIESINVLKDAASAAVYGARAGNGVILVTTKRGGNTKPEFLFTSNYGVQSFTRDPEFTNSEQYAIIENISLQNDGIKPKWSDEQINKFREGSDPAYPNTNWWDMVFSKYAPQTKNDLSVKGGSENVKYFLSGGFLTQESQLSSGDMDYKRYNLRSNIDIKLSKRLDIGLDLNMVLHDYNGPTYDVEREANIGISTALLRSRPYYPSEFPDKTKIPYSGTDIGNPVYHSQIDYAGSKNDNNFFADGKFKIAYKLPFNINFKALYDFNRFYSRNKIRRKNYDFYQYDWGSDVYSKFSTSWFRGDETTNNSAIIETYSLAQSITQQYILDWSKRIGSHNLSALGVFELINSNYEIFKAWRENALFDIDYLFAAPDLNKGNTGSGSEDGRIGFVSRINYDYKGKYFAELNSRYDASPRFPEDSRWGFFPSFSAAWRVSEEEFIKQNFPNVDNLKIRASYGQLGYDNVGNFQYLSTFNISSKYLVNGILENGIRIANLANPDITWEKMTTENIGMDLSMWQNKFSLSFDYFYRLRSDVLGTRSVSMPNVVGASLPAVNYAKYDNRGFEIEVGHKHSIGDFIYNVGANLTWSRQKTILVDQSAFGNDEERRRGEKNGKWTNRWWGYKSNGLFQSEEEIRNWADQDGKNNATILPGDIKLVDLNEDGVINVDDQTMIGRSSFPELMFGINLDAAYKGFDVKMLWQGAGQYNFNYLSANDIFYPLYAGSWVWKFWYDDAWTPENQWSGANTNGHWPRYRTDTNNRTHPNWNKLSDYWLEDGDYIRLKTLELGYTLKKPLLTKYGISNCRIFISGNNLLTFSKIKYIDPEIATTGTIGNYYPQTKVYNVGLSMSF